MPVRRAAQFQIRLPGSDAKPGTTLAVPRHPIDLPSGAYFIWPFNLRLAGITLRYRDVYKRQPQSRWRLPKPV